MNVFGITLGRAKESSSPQFETVPTGTVATLTHRLDTVNEAMARLEFSREDAGWQRISEEGKREFSRERLNHHADLCRVYTVGNPLIKRASKLRAAYVFGGGVGTTASGEDVNVVVQTWLDDPEVRDVFTGAQAQALNETALFTDGNVFFALFTDPLLGRVRPRVLPFEEIVGTLTDPEDSTTTWFYRRAYSVVREDGTEETFEELYPALNYRPLTRAKSIGNLKINWDTPVYHVMVNSLQGWKFGLGDAFAALPWARGYKEFLEDWALLTKALSRLSFQRVDTRGRNAAKAQRSEMMKLNSAQAGSVANSTDGSRIEAVPKTGATIDSESAKPFAGMVAASVDLPVTMLLSDPGQTGARAVAETLDKPMELAMQARQEVWREARRQILNYVIDQAALAPRGPLQGRPLRDGDRLTAVLPKEEDRTLEIVFPDLSETPLDALVSAIADSAQHLPPMFVTRELLRALGSRDVDEWLEKMFDEDGNPKVDPNVSYGNAAVAAVRRGDNPAELA